MANSKSLTWMSHLDFVIIDCLCYAFSQILFVNTFSGLFNNYKESFLSNYIFYGILINILVILFLNPHEKIIQRGYWKEFSSMFFQFSIFQVLMIVGLFATHVISNIPRRIVVLSFLLSFVLDYVIRILVKKMIRRDLKRNDKRNKMVILTTSDRAEELWRQLTTKEYPDFRITALVLLDKERGDYDGIDLMKRLYAICYHSVDERMIGVEPDRKNRHKDYLNILYGINEANEYVRTKVVDEIYLDTNNRDYDWSSIILAYFQMGIEIHIGMPGIDYDYPNRKLSHYGNRLALSISSNKIESWQLIVKRFFDILGALVGLIITGIACLFVVPAIKLADPGPVFFVQKRIGRNGRPFNFYKFRSMYIDAEERKAELMSRNEMQGMMFKIQNDPRIIGSEKGEGKGFGNFIRKTSIDELPQFWNVLCGDMSLIGTRPPTMNEYKQYEMHHKARLSMRPGITGLWQVSGRSNITDFEEVVRLDCEYIENWNFGLDLKILLKTVLQLFKCEGAR